jgi:hypothetical protein
MTTDELTRLRLYNQRISHNPLQTPEEVVSWLCAMQAQDYTGAKWSIGLRLPGMTDTDIEDAIARKAIVRTWPMRGTLHFVAADDVRWISKLLTPRIISGAAGRHRQLELDEYTLSKSHEVLAKALEGGKQLMRSEVYSTLIDNGISSEGQRGIHIINYLAQKQILCHGPHKGKQPTYVLLDEWVPVSKKIDGDEALAELALRYFNSHGPATVHDFIWWSGLKVSDAKKSLDLVANSLEKLEVNGKIFWSNVNHPNIEAVASSFLLPGFDEYILGYADRSLILDAQHANKIVPGNNGMFMPTIVVNGKVIGLWKRTIKGDQVSIETLPFAKFSKVNMKSIMAEAKKFSKYLGKPISNID